MSMTIATRLVMLSVYRRNPT